MNENRYWFLIFDILNFYPKVSFTVFKQALNFAKTLTDISEKDENSGKEDFNVLILFI